MITLKEIKEQQDKLNEMIEKYSKQDNFELEYPKEYTKYYAISDNGEIEEFTFYHDDWEESMFKIGNYFKTYKEAELELKRRKLMVKFNQFKDKCNGEWKSDFMNRDEYKYSIIVFENKMNCDKSFGKNSFCQFGYFKNEDDCEEAIELFGDEIKELYCE